MAESTYPRLVLPRSGKSYPESGAPHSVESFSSPNGIDFSPICDSSLVLHSPQAVPGASKPSGETTTRTTSPTHSPRSFERPPISAASAGFSAVSKTAMFERCK